MSVTKPISAVESVVADLLPELYSKGGCDKIGLTRESFTTILCEIGTKHGATSEPELRTFFLSIRIDELAIARACAAGNNTAWEIFMTRYREKLHLCALRVAREDSAARDLADSLYADLYGTSSREGQRVSKLSSYTGRGSLEGWLRTVLAQEYVNRYRRRQRLVSLEEKTEAGAQFAAADPPAQQAPDPRLGEATDAVLAALAAEERFILAAYYLDGRTLAEIARTLGVHESTISRKLEKVARVVRERIMDELLRRGMSRRQAEEALETDVRDLSLDVSGRLAQKNGASAFYRKGNH